jgi:hypothetical protein
MKSSQVCCFEASDNVTIVNNDLTKEEKSYFDQRKEIVSCWRVAVEQSNTHFLKSIIEKLQETIVTNKYGSRCILVTNALGKLFYAIEYVSPCPNSSFALTLSVAKWPSNDEHQHHQEAGEEDKCLWVLEDEHMNEQQKKSTATCPLEALHKNVSNAKLQAALASILLSFLPNDPNEQSSLKKDVSIFHLELASEHIAKHFSPRDAAYCEWKSGRDGKYILYITLCYGHVLLIFV